MKVVVVVAGGVRDSMYVEFMADTTAGRMVARETLFATSLAEGSRCDRPRYPYEFEALGTEPFWRVTLDGTQLVLERPENPLEQAFVADAPVTRGALTTITARHRAEVRFGGTALRGCARR